VDVQELLGKVAQNLSVSRAFGTAYEKDGSLVIPVALVAGGGGGGEGTAGTPTSDGVDDVEPDVEESVSEGEVPSGSGGGFGGVVMPVGVYVVKDEQVRWIPAVNANLAIILAFLTLRMISRARRRVRRHAS
jgi:uncharacterized spore protein YtfJ